MRLRHADFPSLHAHIIPGTPPPPARLNPLNSDEVDMPHDMPPSSVLAPGMHGSTQASPRAHTPTSSTRHRAAPHDVRTARSSVGAGTDIGVGVGYRDYVGRRPQILWPCPSPAARWSGETSSPSVPPSRSRASPRAQASSSVLLPALALALLCAAGVEGHVGGHTQYFPPSTTPSAVSVHAYTQHTAFTDLAQPAPYNPPTKAHPPYQSRTTYKLLLHPTALHPASLPFAPARPNPSRKTPRTAQPRSAPSFSIPSHSAPHRAALLRLTPSHSVLPRPTLRRPRPRRSRRRHPNLHFLLCRPVCPPWRRVPPRRQ